MVNTGRSAPTAPARCQHCVTVLLAAAGRRVTILELKGASIISESEHTRSEALALLVVVEQDETIGDLGLLICGL